MKYFITVKFTKALNLLLFGYLFDVDKADSSENP